MEGVLYLDKVVGRVQVGGGRKTWLDHMAPELGKRIFERLLECSKLNPSEKSALPAFSLSRISGGVTIHDPVPISYT